MSAATAPAPIAPPVPEKTRAEIRSVTELPAEVAGLEITDTASEEHAGKLLREIKKRGRELEDRRKEITVPMDDAKKAVMDLFRPASNAVAECERVVRKKLAAYAQESERKRALAEAEAAEKARKEEERLRARAEKAAAKGNTEKAAELEMQAASTVAAPVAAPAPASNVSYRENWKAQVSDKMALIKAVANGQASPELLDVNMSVADRLAKALKNTANIPGLRMACQKVPVAR
jgi:hypothetical protein